MSTAAAEDRSDKFTAPKGSVVLSQCCYCKHLTPSNWTAGCKAFPGGIPDEVLTNSLDHRRPVEGDDGVRFEPRPDVDGATLAAMYAALDRR